MGYQRWNPWSEKKKEKGFSVTALGFQWGEKSKGEENGGRNRKGEGEKTWDNHQARLPKPAALKAVSGGRGLALVGLRPGFAPGSPGSSPAPHTLVASPTAFAGRPPAPGNEKWLSPGLGFSRESRARCPDTSHPQGCPRTFAPNAASFPHSGRLARHQNIGSVGSGADSRTPDPWGSGED